MRQDVLADASRQDKERIALLVTERHGLEKDLRAWHGELRSLAGRIHPGEDNGSVMARPADLQERITAVEERVRQVRGQIDAVQNQPLDEDEATRALAAFDPAWGTLTPHEQARVVRLLVEQVDYDGTKGKLSIAFQPAGIKTLAREWADEHEGEEA